MMKVGKTVAFFIGLGFIVTQVKIENWPVHLMYINTSFRRVGTLRSILLESINTNTSVSLCRSQDLKQSHPTVILNTRYIYTYM